MVGKELESQHLVEPLQAVKFDPLVVVNVRPPVLSHSEHIFRVEPLDVVHRVLDIDFTQKPLFQPVHGGYMTLPPSQEQASTVSGVVQVKASHLFVYFSVVKYH